MILASCNKPKSKSKSRSSRPATSSHSPAPKESAVNETYLDEGELLEEGPDEIRLKMTNSILNINYQINKTSVNDTFNAVIDTLLSLNKMRIDEYKVDVEFRKKGRANIEFEGRNVLIDFPLEINATKETFLRTAKAKGLLNLTIVSELDVDNTWNLRSQTRLEDYYWKEVPKFNMGSISLPIEKIMNIIIERSKDKVINEIDKAVTEKFYLREQMINLTENVAQPFLLDQMSDTWLSVDVEKFSLSKVLNAADWMEGWISLNGTTEVTHTPESKRADFFLPDFRWLNIDDEQDTSELFFNVEVQFDRINQMLNENFKGRKFKEGNHEVMVRNLELKGLGEKLGVVAELTGSYNGEVFLSGVPSYNSETKSLETNDIELKLLTKNVLHKALGWMLKGRIRKELDKMMQFSLNDFVGSIQEKIDEQLSNINHENELELTAQMLDLDIEQLKFSKTHIHAGLHAKLKLAVKIYDLLSLERLATDQKTILD